MGCIPSFQTIKSQFLTRRVLMIAHTMQLVYKLIPSHTYKVKMAAHAVGYPLRRGEDTRLKQLCTQISSELYDEMHDTSRPGSRCSAFCRESNETREQEIGRFSRQLESEVMKLVEAISCRIEELTKQPQQGMNAFVHPPSQADIFKMAKKMAKACLCAPAETGSRTRKKMGLHGLSGPGRITGPIRPYSAGPSHPKFVQRLEGPVRPYSAGMPSRQRTPDPYAGGQFYYGGKCTPKGGCDTCWKLPQSTPPLVGHYAAVPNGTSPTLAAGYNYTSFVPVFFSPM